MWYRVFNKPKHENENTYLQICMYARSIYKFKNVKYEICLKRDQTAELYTGC